MRHNLKFLSFIGALAAVPLFGHAQGNAGLAEQIFNSAQRETDGAQTGGTPAASSAQSRNPLSALKDLSQSLLGNNEPQFLDPDQAFKLSAEVGEDGNIALDWDIEDGYYLYRKRFSVKSVGPSSARLGDLQISTGEIKEDPYFGQVEVYYRNAAVRVPVLRESAAPEALLVELAVSYQGCADAGLCYPPITKPVALTLPPGPAQEGGQGAAAGADMSAAPLAELPEQDRIAAALAGESTAWVLLSFFGFGLLLTFTPCVLPMIPILAGIVAGQGEQASPAKAFRLSAVYVLAMASAYTGLGVAAGLSGAGLQAFFQDPVVLVAFALVFVLLSLSMFGFYELQVPTFIQERLAAVSNRQRGGSYAGVAVMGLLSALIVGPCIAPPLAGALIFISQTGEALLGGAALFALSMGMGVPLLIVGTSAGKLLPKAGAWMETVKAVFGVVLLGVAIFLLERVLPDWVSLLLWAVLLIVVGIYLGALDSLPSEASGWRRLWKGSGLVMVVYGVLLMVGASTGGGSLIKPLQGLSVAGKGEAAHDALEFRRIKGLDGLEAALAEARASNRPVMLDYYADWCLSCKEMEAFTFSDAGVQAALAGTLLLQADVTANDEQDQALLKRFGLFGPPAILFFSPDGVELRRYRVVGFMRAEPFAEVVRGATGQSGGTRSAQLARSARRA